LSENGFEDFRPEYLEVLTNEQANVIRGFMLSMLMDEAKQKLPSARWHKYVALFKSNSYMTTYSSITRLCSMLITALADTYNSTDEYMLCFLLVAAYSQI
jgi:hypothetical protein